MGALAIVAPRVTENPLIVPIVCEPVLFLCIIPWKFCIGVCSTNINWEIKFTMELVE